jgi:hypothetical protein
MISAILLGAIADCTIDVPDFEGLGQKLTDLLEHRNQYEEEVENSEAVTFLMRILPTKAILISRV